jgi:type I restriction enzyme S subunit
VSDRGQWIAHVPSEWSTAPIGHHFEERRETVSDRDFTPLSVTKRGVVPQLETAAKTDNNDARKLVRRGDFVINARSDRKGSSGVSELDGSVSVVYSVLTPRPTMDHRYVHHLFRSTAFQEEFYRWGTGIVADLWSTRYALMKAIPVPVPPLSIQRAVADYLDREIAQIDALIEKQERLIVTLLERQVAERDIAVGSDKTVPLRRLADVIDCAHVTATFVDDDVSHPVVSIRELGGVEIDFAGCKYTTESDFALLREGSRTPRPNDLLFVRNVSVGLVSIVRRDTRQFAVGQETVLIRPKEDLHSDFLRHALMSSSATAQLEAQMIGSTFRRINVSGIRALRLPVKDFVDQEKLVNTLSEREGVITRSIERAEQFIELSRERRAALITAAVTGQIDVRGAA